MQLCEEYNDRKQGKYVDLTRGQTGVGKLCAVLVQEGCLPYECYACCMAFALIWCLGLALLSAAKAIQLTKCGSCEDGATCEPGTALCVCTEDGAKTPADAASMIYAPTTRISDHLPLTVVVASCTMASFLAVAIAIQRWKQRHQRRQVKETVRAKEDCTFECTAGGETACLTAATGPL